MKLTAQNNGYRVSYSKKAIIGKVFFGLLLAIAGAFWGGLWLYGIFRGSATGGFVPYSTLVGLISFVMGIALVLTARDAIYFNEKGISIKEFFFLKYLSEKKIAWSDILKISSVDRSSDIQDFDIIDFFDKTTLHIGKKAKHNDEAILLQCKEGVLYKKKQTVMYRPKVKGSSLYFYLDKKSQESQIQEIVALMSEYHEKYGK